MSEGREGVERRGEKLAVEYRKRLAKFDTRYHGTPHGQVGPLVRRLNSYGKDVHSLLGFFADAQLEAKGLAKGREGSGHMRSVILFGMRRQIMYDSCQGLVCLPPGQGREGGGGPQTGGKEEVLAEEGDGEDGGGAYGILVE